jgi:hypothetical protein
MRFGTSRARGNPEREPLAAGHLETVTTETILALAYPMILGLGRLETARRLRRSAVLRAISARVAEPPTAAVASMTRSPRSRDWWVGDWLDRMGRFLCFI